MTYREKIKETNPEFIDGTYAGGVNGCPGSYFKGAPGGCRHWSHEQCFACRNTEMPESKIPGVHTEQKKPETPMDLIAKALESNDKSVHIRVEPDGITSVDIVPVGAFKETEEEPVSELGQLNEQEAKEAIRFLQSKFKLGPKQNVVKHGYWREIKYHTDENGKRSLVEDGLTASACKPVILPFEPTHWMPVPEPPKED
jgi:hypothetical protein